MRFAPNRLERMGSSGPVILGVEYPMIEEGNNSYSKCGQCVNDVAFAAISLGGHHGYLRSAASPFSRLGSLGRGSPGLGARAS